MRKSVVLPQLGKASCAREHVPEGVIVQAHDGVVLKFSRVGGWMRSGNGRFHTRVVIGNKPRRIERGEMNAQLPWRCRIMLELASGLSCTGKSQLDNSPS